MDVEVIPEGKVLKHGQKKLVEYFLNECKICIHGLKCVRGESQGNRVQAERWD